MKKICLLLFASYIMVLTVDAQSRVRDSKTSYAKEALQPYVDKGELAGAISVFYKDGVQETSCVGYADVSQKRAIDSTTSLCNAHKPKVSVE